MVLNGCDLISTAMQDAALASAYLRIARADARCSAGFAKLAKRRLALARQTLDEWTGGLSVGALMAPANDMGADPLSGLRGPPRSVATGAENAQPQPGAT